VRYVGATANNVFDVSDSDLCLPETLVKSSAQVAPAINNCVSF
jgi:hypothetical protein